MRKLKCKIVVAFGMAVLFSAPVLAADFTKDLSISPSDVRIPENILKGQTGKFYAKIHNNSKSDLAGVVKFYDEKTGQYIGSDQPISALSGGTDDVFLDWSSDVSGEHRIAIRVVPWDAKNDNPDNNKVTGVTYIDADTDGDGIGNRLDSDDDNDGAPDAQDAFPLDAREFKDNDKDGIGDVADPDDDNDGAPDVQDVFPTDPMESEDSDQDGVGENRDVFPLDPKESADSDQDGKGDFSDLQPQNHSPIPVIQASSPKTDVRNPVTFNGIKSSDPDDPIASYDWDFGDGIRSTGVLVDHAFKKAGSYSVILKVTDVRGESDERQILIQAMLPWNFYALILSSFLLLLLLLGLILPRSPFHYRRLSAMGKRRPSKR